MRIFFQSFDGEICHIWTIVTYRMNKKNNWRMCIKGACTILAGKLLIFKQPLIKYVSQNHD